jgi:hypothetical protein
MRFRPRHLVCMLLLLSTFGVAASAVPCGSTRLSHLASVGITLHGQSLAALFSSSSRNEQAADEAALPTGSRTHCRAVWTMRPAAQQAVALQAVTATLA